MIRWKGCGKERGGGVGILVKSTITWKQLPTKHFTSFEHTVVNIPLMNKKPMFLIAIYRLQFVATTMFIEEFSELVSFYAVSNDDFVIAGDINIMLKLKNYKFIELLDMMF